VKDLLYWISEVVKDKGVATIDSQEYRHGWAQIPPFIGMTRYLEGIDLKSTLNGRDYTNILKQIVVITMNGIGDTLEMCVQAVVNFVYCATLPIHSDLTIGWMSEFIKNYNDTREVQIGSYAGVCQIFKIYFQLSQKSCNAPLF
jgi:hypothetical protein